MTLCVFGETTAEKLDNSAIFRGSLGGLDSFELPRNSTMHPNFSVFSGLLTAASSVCRLREPLTPVGLKAGHSWR